MRTSLKVATLMEKIKTSLLYNLGSALFAFTLWGGWAYFINRNSISALTQGAASFIITLFLVHAVTKLYRSLPAKANGILQLFSPAIITVTFTGTCLYIAHRIAGTEHIAKTIAPALLIAFVFCVYTAYRLLRGEHNV